MEWVLASQSPRRRELLSRVGVKFRIQVAHTDEVSLETAPEEIAKDLSRQKALAVREMEPDACIIAADTIVVLDGEVLNKPVDRDENRVFISRLAGRTHQVMTGVTISTPEVTHSDVEITQVKFRSLTEREIEWYVQSGEGLDKAGGYGIQELGALLVEGVEGDYFNVVGLPLVRLLMVSRQVGQDLLGAHV
ncbi:Maf family protein [Deinococcus cellulosilyticus]|uniref:dTTP/UTP pyrophosphatase n=1 Tax=Deinococcus cellulosilyticus (strain DSM 18568 / NBRC 106333 / KACC 11606 / 5516J-15) TaxID=1223518 RepID=A0A511N101_DEIC1|nr:Maf family protein [Deinococcus cellulosilyticus]GEM46137.1 Maf-like protein [Deinococcus cellulosilyticus NBRC 106333 = KACC 11606]